MIYSNMEHDELLKEYDLVLEAFNACKAKGLKLDMSRGKPSSLQLDGVSDILTALTDMKDCKVDGIDVRNYGTLDGLPSAKKLFAEILGCQENEVVIGGSASLSLMFDTICAAYVKGLLHSERPWKDEKVVKFLCPAPGYDRHFKITEYFGFELITIPMKDDGPDMDMVESYVKDPAVKGIWCVPKYSNPDGIIFSEKVVNRFANLKPAAPDFVIMWDNAYCVHQFNEEYVEFPDIISLCRKAGKPDMVFEFASTSKVTLPGAGISCMASSPENLKYMQKILGIAQVCFDKVNQARHVKYLQNKAHALEIMKRHAKVMAPKFECVIAYLEKEIKPRGLATWQNPHGGYFVSVNVMNGCAHRTWELCKEAGVVMTDAGATFPYGKDPNDSNMRVAPSLPPVAELEAAMEVYCIALRLASLEKLLSK